MAADPWRKSRLHDMRGHFVGRQAILRDGPRCLAGAALRKVAGYYPPLPWIPYPAIERLESLAEPTWRVLEHGAGMSTIWWSYRVAAVDSIEASAEWYERVRRHLDTRGLKNVSLELRTGDHYSDLSSFPDHSYNLMVIDGHARESVALQAPRLITRPGWIYLDNTDFAAQWHDMYGEAEDILRGAAEREGATLTYFTGFAPATLVASQGLLVSFPGR